MVDGENADDPAALGLLGRRRSIRVMVQRERNRPLHRDGARDLAQGGRPYRRPQRGPCGAGRQARPHPHLSTGPADSRHNYCASRSMACLQQDTESGQKRRKTKKQKYIVIQLSH